MKSVFAIVGCMFLVSACEKTDLAANLTVLSGTWKTGCYFNGQSYTISTYTFKDSQLWNTIDDYWSSTCGGEPSVSKIFETFSFRLGGANSALSSATNIDMTVLSSTCVFGGCSLVTVGHKVLGIFKIDGSTLTANFGDLSTAPAESTRPTNFTGTNPYTKQ